MVWKRIGICVYEGQVGNGFSTSKTCHGNNAAIRVLEMFLEFIFPEILRRNCFRYIVRSWFVGFLCILGKSSSCVSIIFL